MTDDEKIPTGIEASRQNRVLRLRVQKLDEAWEKQRKITKQIERSRQYTEDMAKEMTKERNRLQVDKNKLQNALFEMSAEIGWLHAQLMAPGTAEEYVAEYRSDQNRCPMCGCAETYPADYMRSDDGDFGVGLTCSGCGYSENVFVEVYRPFVAPSQPGSHDTIGDYGLQLAALPWVLRRVDRYAKADT